MHWRHMRSCVPQRLQTYQTWTKAPGQCPTFLSLLEVSIVSSWKPPWLCRSHGPRTALGLSPRSPAPCARWPSGFGPPPQAEKKRKRETKEKGSDIAVIGWVWDQVCKVGTIIAIMQTWTNATVTEGETIWNEMGTVWSSEGGRRSPMTPFSNSERI